MLDNPPKRSELPTSPGVYKWKNGEGKVIYVGKAKNLRNRLSHYFQPPSALPAKTQAMLCEAKDLEWTVVENESEALSLEYAWIKEFSPKFNVIFRDDKSYPSLALSCGDFPRLSISRGKRKRGVSYFGPYPNLKLSSLIGPLREVFPLRTCNNAEFKKHSAHQNACIFYEIGMCPGPCIGKISSKRYSETLKSFSQTLTFPEKAQEKLRKIREKMKKESENFNFEGARKCRDQIAALEKLTGTNLMAGIRGEFDVFSMAEQERSACFYLASARGGFIRGEKSWIVDFIGEESKEELLSQLLISFYFGNGAPRLKPKRISIPEECFSRSAPDFPKEILVPFLPDGRKEIEEKLENLSGRKITIRVPQRGVKKGLLDEAGKNAGEEISRLKEGSIKNPLSRMRALERIKGLLSLTSLPVRIEGFDISNSAKGDSQAGSCVSFVNGLKNPGGYKKFRLAGKKDDLSAMREVVRRRFETRSAPPDLLLVDGGPSQLKAARRGMEDANAGNGVFLAALSKKLEEVWMEGCRHPLILSRFDPALLLFEEIRDESHRFAINYHRQLRRKHLVQDR